VSAKAGSGIRSGRNPLMAESIINCLKGAYTESFSIGPELMQICYINREIN
jgi:hypothetical protein